MNVDSPAAVRASDHHNPFLSDSPSNTGDSDKESKTVCGESEADEKTADFHVIAHVSNLVSVQIDHYQLLFLLRLSDEMTELATFLSLDSNRILQKV